MTMPKAWASCASQSLPPVSDFTPPSPKTLLWFLSSSPPSTNSYPETLYTAGVHWFSRISVFLLCSNKLLQSQWLETTQNLLFYSSVGQTPDICFTGLKSRCTTFWKLWKELIYLPFPACRGHPHILTHGPFFHLQSQQRSISLILLPHHFSFPASSVLPPPSTFKDLCDNNEPTRISQDIKASWSATWIPSATLICLCHVI